MSKIEEILIGGTHLCGHGHMAVCCPICPLEAQLARAEKVIKASRRHIRSFEPGTLVGSELNLACELRDLEGDIWQPWCVPGELEYDRPSAPLDGRDPE